MQEPEPRRNPNLARWVFLFQILLHLRESLISRLFPSSSANLLAKRSWFCRTPTPNNPQPYQRSQPASQPARMVSVYLRIRGTFARCNEGLGERRARQVSPVSKPCIWWCRRDAAQSNPKDPRAPRHRLPRAWKPGCTELRGAFKGSRAPRDRCPRLGQRPQVPVGGGILGAGHRRQRRRRQRGCGAGPRSPGKIWASGGGSLGPARPRPRIGPNPGSQPGSRTPDPSRAA